jgi:hypothetical protein
MMKFYTGQHKLPCGVDLHARTMFLYVLDDRGYPLLERNIKTDPELFLKTIAPYREDIVVAVECMFTWYWFSDLGSPCWPLFVPSGSYLCISPSLLTHWP